MQTVGMVGSLLVISVGKGVKHVLDNEKTTGREGEECVRCSVEIEWYLPK